MLGVVHMATLSRTGGATEIGNIVLLKPGNIFLSVLKKEGRIGMEGEGFNGRETADRQSSAVSW